MIATSFLFLFTVIAKLERTQSNAQQNKEKHRTHTTNGKEAHQTTEQQQQNHRLRRDSTLSHRGA